MFVLIRNVIAVFVAMVIGSIVNMGLVMLGPVIIPVPEGVDMMTAEGISHAILNHKISYQHYVFPFLAHAIGTLAGACVAALISAKHRVLVTFIVGGLFMAGGIANFFMIPSPVWFILVDVLLGYLPMAYLGLVIARKLIPDAPKTSM